MSDLASYFGTESVRPDERTVVTRLALHDDLRDEGGALRAGAVAYGVDVSTGLAMGLAVLDRDLWVVTTDLDVQLVAPVVAGPLRIESWVVRAGETTAVALFRLYDEGADPDRAVGGGTVTGRPFPFSFDRGLLEMPVGSTRRYGDPAAARPAEPLVRHLGFTVGEDASVAVDVGGWLRNPWGILHGGVTACLADVAASSAGAAALGGPARVASQLVRYLAPGRVGPVRATPSVVAVEGGRALVEVRVVDSGADDRLCAVATVGVAAFVRAG